MRFHFRSTFCQSNWNQSPSFFSIVVRVWRASQGGHLRHLTDASRICCLWNLTLALSLIICSMQCSLKEGHVKHQLHLGILQSLETLGLKSLQLLRIRSSPSSKWTRVPYRGSPHLLTHFISFWDVNVASLRSFHILGACRLLFLMSDFPSKLFILPDGSTIRKNRLADPGMLWFLGLWVAKNGIFSGFWIFFDFVFLNSVVLPN